MARVLIVSDDPQMAKLIGLNLDKRNYERTLCDATLTAIGEKEDFDFDLVLLDVDLSQERYWEAARRVGSMSSAKQYQ